MAVDVQGFPGRFSYAESGGLQRDRFAVTVPVEQLSLRVISAMRWQIAGLNKTGPLVTLTIAADGTRNAGGEAWNSEDAPARRVAITHPATGVYVVAAQASSYTDWRGDSGPPVAVVFTGAIVSPQSATSVRPPTYTLDSATQITVYTWDAAGLAADMPFTVDIK